MHPGLIVAFALLAALIVFGLRGWERLVRARRQQEPAAGRAAPPDADPDRPRPFAAAATWLCVPAATADAVARLLGLRTALPSNWRAGLDGVASEGAFVTPAVRGFVLVVGRDLERAALDFAQTERWLRLLSGEFGEAWWFCTDEHRDVHGWARAARGVLQRGYAYTEERGHCWWVGECTAAEVQLGCFVDDPRDSSDDDVKWWPDRAVVRALAAAWTLDPMRLSAEDAVEDVGRVGRL